MVFERYREAVRYLVDDLWHGGSRGARLEDPQARIKALLEATGNPHRTFPVIHVGGTTGKGSTATMVAVILEEAGMRVGLYVSPFLQTFVERISVNGKLIGPEEFAAEVQELKPLVAEMEARRGAAGRPTILEVLFAIGMQHFAREGVDVGVVEVGLGGRTDCTNVFDPSVASVITNVQLDHTRQLGDTPALIAAEKAAIVRPGSRAVTGAIGEALAVIEARCQEVDVELWSAGREIALERRECGVQVTTPRRRLVVAPAMAGRHQEDNAALAVAAVDAFAPARNLPISDAAVQRGIARACQPGRFEVVQREPTVILDGAHNPAAAAVLANELAERLSSAEGRLWLLIGILEDKDREGILSQLVPLADRVVVTRPPLEERAGVADDVLAIARRYLREKATSELIEDPMKALDRVLAGASDADFVCATGSIYLIGQLRGHWFPEEQLLAERRIPYATFGSA